MLGVTTVFGNRFPPQLEFGVYRAAPNEKLPAGKLRVGVPAMICEYTRVRKE